MMKQILQTVGCLLLFLAFHSCGGNRGGNSRTEYRISADRIEKGNTDDFGYRRWWFSENNKKGNMAEIKRYGRQVYAAAEQAGDRDMMALSGVYLSWACLVCGETDSVEQYLPVVTWLSRTDTMTALGLLANNVCAIRAIHADLDYSTALRYFYKGLRIAREHNDTINTAIFLTNISNIYSIREDTSGVSVAEEAYRLCRHSDQPHVVVSSALNLADLLLLQNRCDESMDYADRALALAEQAGDERYIGRCHLIRARVCASIGKREEAFRSFRMAERFLSQADMDVQVKYRVEYGAFLLKVGRSREAVVQLEAALGMSGCTPEQKWKILKLLPSAYSLCGMDSEALACYKHSSELADSLSFYRKEQDFNRLRMQYEQSRYEQDLLQKDLIIQKKEKTIILIALLAVMATGIIVFQIRRERMYRQLVGQHQQHLLITRKMKEEKNAVEETDREKKKERELYGQIESLMYGPEKIYRRKDLTVEKLCETLHSNRSYVSRVINNFSGMTFVNYVNYLRIVEATEILSDPGNDMPLKMLADQVGYNSLSTFYRAFQKETGCSPSKYRQEIRKKGRNDLSEQKI